MHLSFFSNFTSRQPKDSTLPDIINLIRTDELDKLFLALSQRIYEVADDEDFSAYRIIDSHAGSPIKRAKYQKSKR